MYTNGLKDRFGSPLASQRDVEKQITGQIYNKVEHESLSLSNASNEAEVNCIAIKSAYLQHNKEFTEFSILPKDSNTDTPLYMYALLENNGAKTVIGLSDEAITWEAGTEAVWKFTNNPITIPDGKNIEMFMITGQSAIPSSGDPTPPGRHIKIHCNSNMSGAGSTRWNTGWTSNRLVYCKFIEKSGQLVSKTHADETYLTEESANGIYLLQSDESVVKKNYIRESYDLEYCPDTAEVNGISLSSLYIPHNRTINKVSVLAKDMNLDTPLYLYVYTVKNGTKTRVGLSDEAILWTTDELVTWTFNQNPITIPDGANIEMYLVENEEAAAGVNEPNYPSRHIKIACKNNETNAGGTRYWGKWTMNRVVYCFFTDADYKYIENETVENTYLTKTEAHLKFATKEENKPYDWTPDWVHAIHSTNTSNYTAPTNGWISTTHNSRNGEVFVNEQIAGYNCASGSYTMLLREGDTISFPATANFLFAPCNAEQEDWRDVKTNYDIWKNAICYDSNGTPYVQNLYIPSAASWAENVRIPHYLTITKVEDEKAYNGENFVCNIQSTEIENGTFLFYGYNINGVDTVADIQTWDSDLDKLKAAGYMFCRSNLNSFTGNLDSLTRGYQMFYNSRLANFSTPMPELVNAYLMFATTALTEFNVENLPKLSNGEAMFAYTNISSFNTDMPHLSNAREMFMATPNLTDFDADLSNLKTGWKMFGDGVSALAKLSDDSIQRISRSIKDINGMNRDDDSLWKYDSTKTDGTVTLNGSTIGRDYRGVIHINCQDGQSDSAMVTDAMETIVAKGWIAYLNGSIFEGTGGVTFTIYDVSSRNGYIPDASNWNSNIYTPNKLNNLVITEVKNTKAQNNGIFVCNIDSNLIVNGTALMRDNSVLVEWDSDLSNLTNGNGMFLNCAELVGFYGDLSSLTTADGMFSSCTKLSICQDDIATNSLNLSNLENGNCMFQNCSKISNVNFILGELKNGTSMFANSGVTFSRIYNELGTLQTAKEMFYLCSANHWYGHLPNLNNGSGMFRACFNLEHFASGTNKGNGTELNAEAIDMDSLTDGSRMFEDCNKLEYFCAHCDNLKIAYSMFKGCPKLKKVNFASGLTSLQNADNMFDGCSELTFTCNSNYHEMHQAVHMFSNSYKVGTTDQPFVLDAPNLVTAYWMFANTTEVVITPSDVSNIHEGQGMFYQCNNLVLANTSNNAISFSYLSNGVDMFNGCNIRNREINMSFGSANNYLTKCSGMFGYCTGYDYDGNLSYLHLHDCKTDYVNFMFGEAKFENVQINRFDFTNGMSEMFNYTKVRNIEIRDSVVRGNCYLSFSSKYDLNVKFDNVQWNSNDIFGIGGMFGGAFETYQNWPYMRNHYTNLTIRGFDAKLNSVNDATLAFQSRWFSDAESLSAVNYVGEYNNISTDYVSGTGFHGSVWTNANNFLGYIGVASNGNLVVDFLTQGKWSVISSGNDKDGIHNMSSSPFKTYLIEKYNQHNKIIGAYLQTEADLSDLIDTSQFDVTGKYIPDASKWNDEVYQPNKSSLKIVEVLGGVASDVKTKI